MSAAWPVDAIAGANCLKSLHSVVSLKYLKGSLTSLRYRLSFGELLHAAAVPVWITMDVADVYKCMQTHTNANAHMHMCKRSVLLCVVNCV